MRGPFIVFEGPDKSGKSTQAAFLVRALKARGLKVLHTREPGGTPLGEKIRRLLLRDRSSLSALGELFLYEAARAQHTQDAILPALKSGAVVVSERYALASLAYQGHGRGLDLGLIRKLNAAATRGLEADLTVLLDIPVSEFSRRPRRGVPDRLEKENQDFKTRVRRGYRYLARTEPRLWLVDGRASADVIHGQILDKALSLL